MRRRWEKEDKTGKVAATSAENILRPLLGNQVKKYPEHLKEDKLRGKKHKQQHQQQVHRILWILMVWNHRTTQQLNNKHVTEWMNVCVCVCMNMQNIWYRSDMNCAQSWNQGIRSRQRGPKTQAASSPHWAQNSGNRGQQPTSTARLRLPRHESCEGPRAPPSTQEDQAPQTANQSATLCLCLCI